MNLNVRHFLRMAKWGRNPPSAKRVKMIAAILVGCLILFGIERYVGWPAWLTMDSVPGGRMTR